VKSGEFWANTTWPCEMTELLQDKIALITGATRGIGFATAQVFAEQGAQVVLTGRSLVAAQAACQRILATQPQARLEAQVLDVTDQSSVKTCFQTVFRTHGRLDTLVANAGIMEDALLGMVNEAQMQRTFETNTFGVIRCAQYASRLMARGGQGGSIVNLTSIIGTQGNVGQVVYSASKAAVIGITRSLAKELAAQNIRVNAVAPGFIDTDMARSISSEKFEQRLAAIRMGRIGTPEEVARVVLFLACGWSSYVTGQVIGVDAGMLI